MAGRSIHSAPIAGITQHSAAQKLLIKLFHRYYSTLYRIISYCALATVLRTLDLLRKSHYSLTHFHFCNIYLWSDLKIWQQTSRSSNYFAYGASRLQNNWLRSRVPTFAQHCSFLTMLRSLWFRFAQHGQTTPSLRSVVVWPNLLSLFYGVNANMFHFGSHTSPTIVNGCFATYNCWRRMRSEVEHVSVNTAPSAQVVLRTTAQSLFQTLRKVLLRRSY